MTTLSFWVHVKLFYHTVAYNPDDFKKWLMRPVRVCKPLRVFVAVVGRWRHRLPCQHRWHSASRQLCRWPRWCRQIPSVGLWRPDDRARAYVWRSSSQSAQLCRLHATYVGCRKRYQKSHSVLSNSGMKRPDKKNFCCLCKAPCCRVSLSIYLLLCLLCTDEFLSAKTAPWDGKNWLGLDTDDDNTLHFSTWPK